MLITFYWKYVVTLFIASFQMPIMSMISFRVWDWQLNSHTLILWVHNLRRIENAGYNWDMWNNKLGLHSGINYPVICLLIFLGIIGVSCNTLFRHWLLVFISKNIFCLFIFEITTPKTMFFLSLNHNHDIGFDSENLTPNRTEGYVFLSP